MRLVTYSVGPAGTARAGVRVGHRVLDIEAASRVKGEPLPSSVKALLAAGRGALARVQALAKAAATEAKSFSHAMHEEGALRLHVPVPDAGRFLCACAGGELDHATAASGWDLLGHDAKVRYPDGASALACGPVLVFVIGRRAQGIGEVDDAMDYVAGITILNALSHAGAGKGDARVAALARPLGPEIVTLDEMPDLHESWMTCLVNGEERMRVSTHEAVLRLPGLLRDYSRDIAVEPGDLLCPAAPADAAAGKSGAPTRFLEPGDVVECAIEGQATLRTTIVPAAA